MVHGGKSTLDVVGGALTESAFGEYAGDCSPSAPASTIGTQFPATIARELAKIARQPS